MSLELDTAGRPTSVDPCRDLIDRRVVLERAIGGALAVAVTGVGVPAAVYLWPIRDAGAEGEVVKLGQESELSVGDAKLIKVREAPLLLVRESQQKIRAFSAVCTHLGCLVQWRKATKDIACPCHGGRFDLDGKVLAGPPPRPLAQYAVSIVDGEIQVDLKTA